MPLAVPHNGMIVYCTFLGGAPMQLMHLRLILQQPKKIQYYGHVSTSAVKSSTFVVAAFRHHRNRSPITELETGSFSIDTTLRSMRPLHSLLPSCHTQHDSRDIALQPQNWPANQDWDRRAVTEWMSKWQQHHSCKRQWR